MKVIRLYIPTKYGRSYWNEDARLFGAKSVSTKYFDMNTACDATCDVMDAGFEYVDLEETDEVD